MVDSGRGRALVVYWFLCLGAAWPLAAQCPDGSPPPCARTAPAGPAPGANSVGVMLFDNLNRDTAYAYLSDGLASEIAATLARVPRLEVRSPGAVRSAQRGIEPDPRTVGRRLNVRNVVEVDLQRGVATAIAGQLLPQERSVLAIRATPRGALLWWAMQFPELNALRSDPRFQRVIDESRPPGIN